MQLIDSSEPVRLPTAQGLFWARAWRFDDGLEHLSLTGASRPLHPEHDAAPLVRIHSECLTGDVLGSRRCDCGAQLQSGLERIQREGGALVYLRGQEGRGIGLLGKLRAYRLQEQGMDTVEANLALGYPAESRTYVAAAVILRELGLRNIRLLSNNPAKACALESLGIGVEAVPHETEPTPESMAYLRAKRDRMGHRLRRLSST